MRRAEAVGRWGPRSLRLRSMTLWAASGMGCGSAAVGLQSLMSSSMPADQHGNLLTLPEDWAT